MAESDRTSAYDDWDDTRRTDGDPFAYGREGHQSTWDRIRNTADRIMSRTLDVAGDVAQRGIIEVEIASLRLRLKNAYSRLGELLFRMKVAEERSGVFDDPAVLDLFEQIQILHHQIADERAKMDALREMAHRDDVAGA